MFVKFCSIDTNVLKWSFFSNIAIIGGRLNFQNIGKTKLRMPNKNSYIRKRHNRTICALYISNNLVSTYDLVYSRSSTIFGLTSVFAFWNIFSEKKARNCTKSYMLPSLLHDLNCWWVWMNDRNSLLGVSITIITMKEALGVIWIQIMYVYVWSRHRYN